MRVHEETMLEAIRALTVPGDLTADEKAFLAGLESYRARRDELTAYQSARLKRIYAETVELIEARRGHS